MSTRRQPTSAAGQPDWHELVRLAIVGAATLKGKEINEVLQERNFRSADVRLLDDQESLGQLEAVGDEINFVQSVRPQQFSGVDIAFFASDAAFTKSHWYMARDAGSSIIDVSYALEQEPGAQVRAPWMDRELGRAATLTDGAERSAMVIAHPAAVVLALLMARAQRAAGVRNAVVTILEPASEQGKSGMDELHQQTVNLLSFQQMPKEVFDSQVAFNMLPRYGSNSTRNLEAVERRILEHYRQITRPLEHGAASRATVRHAFGENSPASAPLISAAGSAAIAVPESAAPTPSVALLQAPTFHSYAFSIFLEMANAVSTSELAQLLAGEHVTVVDLLEEPPSNVSAAGQNEIQVAIRRDAGRENAVWLWAAADNLKITALNAVACAEAAVAMRAKGRIQ